MPADKGPNVSANRNNSCTDSANERGQQWGAFYRAEGREYARPYPSNPYHPSDPRHEEYASGYEDGFNAR